MTIITLWGQISSLYDDSLDGHLSWGLMLFQNYKLWRMNQLFTVEAMAIHTNWDVDDNGLVSHHYNGLYSTKSKWRKKAQNKEQALKPVKDISTAGPNKWCVPHSNWCSYLHILILHRFPFRFPGKQWTLYKKRDKKIKSKSTACDKQASKSATYHNNVWSVDRIIAKWMVERWDQEMS